MYLTHTPPQRKKFVRANESPFMTKQLRKFIMDRSRCKNSYYKNKTVNNWEKYRKLTNVCVKATKKAKTEYFANFNMKMINDNKQFWKIMKTKFCINQKIVLVEKNEIIKDNKQNAEIMNSYFINVAKNLNIPEFTTEKIPENTIIECFDPIDCIIHEYSKHPSILEINDTTTPLETFSFNKINEMHTRTEILALNTKKSTRHDSIPPKIIKGSVSILTIPLRDLFNVSLEKCLFPSDLKYADITPLFKKDDNTNKDRPISILPCI